MRRNVSLHRAKRRATVGVCAMQMIRIIDYLFFGAMTAIVFGLLGPALQFWWQLSTAAGIVVVGCLIYITLAIILRSL